MKDGVMIDHLVYASNDLPSASATVAELLGATPIAGGRHVGHGTYNELLALGGATYLEVIGPDPSQPAPDGPRPFGIDGRTRPALVAWCVRPQRPLAEIITDARAAGIELGEVAAMSRRRPDGVLLEWKLTFPQLSGRFGSALPFMIDWGQSSHPTDTLPAAVRLVGLEVTQLDAGLLRAAFDIIGITTEVDLHEGPPSLRATIATQAGEVTLTS
jgi:Glyoxalase-like domain